MACSLEDTTLTKQEMHKIFFIPEILDEIFSHSSKHTQTVLARVCQMWFTRSISFVWDRVQLNNALSILSPFVPDDGSFQQPLFPDAWQRFFLYSENIRFLECSDINYTALVQAALYRPSSTDLFSSKLTIIAWKGAEEHVNCLFPFLSPTLRALAVSLDVVNNSDVVDSLCKTIAFRSPLLRVLGINIPHIADHALQISRSLGKLTSVLLDLFSVSIPIHFMTTESFMILSRLPRVEAIYMSGTINAEDDLEQKALYKGSEKESLPFRFLTYLDIFDASRNQTFSLATVLSQGIRFFALGQLCCSPWCESSDQVIALMESVHVVCPNLEIIWILGKNCSSGHLPWEAIQALLKCKELHSLEVHNSTIDMVLFDIVTLATNRPFWKAVVLPSTTPLSYQALVSFAQNCPSLVKLGLSLNNDSEFPDLQPDVWFSSLAMLNVANSMITSPVEVGIFMSSICPKSLEIKATGTHAPSWKAVEKLVNSVNKTAQVRMLNKEIAVQAKEITSLRKSQSQVSEGTLHSISTQTDGSMLEPESTLSFKSN